MSIKIIYKYITLIIVFFSWTHFAYAGFEITEIMYDTSGADTDREWIEVQNTGSLPDDLSKWYFFSDNTKHTITPLGVSIIPAGEYAVVAQNPQKFKVDWSSYSGLLFDSSWTGLSNSGETIALKDPNGNIVSPINFSSSAGGSGNGDSLQKIGNAWIGSSPTPGEVNKESPKVTKAETTTPQATLAKTKSNKKLSSRNTSSSSSENISSVIDLDTLGASAGGDYITISKSTLAWLGLVGAIVLGSGAMLIFSKRSPKNERGENLTAEDIDIV